MLIQTFPPANLLERCWTKNWLCNTIPLELLHICTVQALTSLFLLSICFLLFGKTQNKKYQFSLISYTMRISPHTGILEALSRMWWCQLALYKPQKLGSMAHNIKREGLSWPFLHYIYLLLEEEFCIKIWKMFKI